VSKGGRLTSYCSFTILEAKDNSPYTYVDRKLPYHSRGQALPHTQTRYAASYGNYLILNSALL